MPTAFKNVKNRVLTTIKVASSINNTDDPVTFNITDPSAFPAAPFYITVEVVNDDTVYERMLVTAIDGDELVATRAQDGSTKQTFSAGDWVMIRVIAKHIDDITGAVNKLEDIKDYANSPMIVTGGLVSVGTNAGTFKVAILTALLRKTDSLTGELTYVTKALEDNIAITAADTTYFVSLNYNAGSPTISVSATNPYTADKRNIPIGKVRKDGADNVHFINSAFGLQDGVRKLHDRARELRELELESGSAIAYSGTNNFTMGTGVVYGGINRIALSSYDSVGVVFTYIYRDGIGGWTEVADQNVIDFAHYDDGDGTPGNVGNNKYSCHWVYKHADDEHVFVVLGRGNYTLGQAEEANEPTRPTYLIDFGVLIGKIIAPQAGGSFTLVQMVTERFFTGTAVSNHQNLAGLANDDHTQYALLAGHSGGQVLSGSPDTGEDLTLQDNTTDNNSITVTQIIAKQNALTFGIADTNAVRIDGADIASGEYARFTANGLESRTIGEIKSALSLVKADVGLGNVDNTSDANKPISTATQNALDLKAGSGANTDITSLQNTGLYVGRDADNKIDWGTDDHLKITIAGDLTDIVSISTGIADNDKLVTQGYVDDSAGNGGLVYYEIIPVEQTIVYNAWRNWDVSAWVPVDAKYAQVKIRHITSSSNLAVGVRKDGSSLERKWIMTQYTIQTVTVEVNSNQIIELWHNHPTATSFYWSIIGYWK